MNSIIDKAKNSIRPLHALALCCAIMCALVAFACGSAFASDDAVVQLKPQSLTTAEITTQDTTNWGLESIYAKEAQTYVAAHHVDTGKPVCVAILDTGFYDHPDFSGKVVARWNAAAEMPDKVFDLPRRDVYKITDPFTNLELSAVPSDVEPSAKLTNASEESESNPNHGTHVAGIVHAIAPEANLILIRVANADGVINTGALYNAYALVNKYQEDFNIRIVNFSGGTALDSPFVYEADDSSTNDTSWESRIYDQIDAAYEKGIVTVCSAGNEYDAKGPYVNYPSDYEKVVSVMALAMQDKSPFEVELDSKSNRNDPDVAQRDATKDICAPGKNIYSSIGADGHGRMSGTSMAAPHVAGVLALMFSSDSTLTTAQSAIDKLYATATDLGGSGWDATYAHGEVNALAAVGGNAMRGIEEVPVTPATADEAGRYYAQYSAYGANGSDTWTWSVDKPAIAEVESTGNASCKLFGKTAGTVTLTATSATNPEAVVEKEITIAPISFTYLGSKSKQASEGYPVQDRLFLYYKQPTYSGDPLAPIDVIVTCGATEETATTLDPNEDYTISCSNNIDAGTETARITINGKPPNYTGSKTFGFTIKQASMKDAEVVISPASTPYTGSQIRPQVTVKYNGKTLKEGVDYSLLYTKNVSIGTAQVEVKGLKNFKSTSITKSFTITRKTQPAIVKAAKSTVKVKYSKVKKKKQKVACPISVTKAEGTVKYSIQSVTKKAAKKKIDINAKTGKLTVKKGCKKGSYKVTIRVTVETDKTSKYNGAAYSIPITVRVK